MDSDDKNMNNNKKNLNVDDYKMMRMNYINKDSCKAKTERKKISSISINVGAVMIVAALFILIMPASVHSLLSMSNYSVNNSINSISTLSSIIGSINSTLSSSATSSSASSNVTLSNSDLTTIISLSNIYYTENDLVDIYISNSTSIAQSGELSLEISMLEDPTYSFRYLGLVENKISFIPEKAGTYSIKLYSITNSSYVFVAEKIFHVYDAKTYVCEKYTVNSVVNIDLKSYTYYATHSLPDSLTLVYTDDQNNSDVYVYSDKIEGSVNYKFARPGRYVLFSEGMYLDCFNVEDSNSSNLNSGNSDVNTTVNSSVDAALIGNSSNVSDAMIIGSSMTVDTITGENISNNESQGNLSQINPNELLQTSLLSGDRQATYNEFYSRNSSKNFDFSKDALLDIHGMDNSFVIAEISRNDTYGLILELWSINVKTGAVSRIAYNESAPSYNIRPGIKDDVVFWVSEYNDKIYAYDTVNNLTMYRNLPSYDISKGELGRVSFNDTAINNEQNVGWDVIVDGSQVYFYNPKEGEVFSDDNSDIKEQFRHLMNLDSYYTTDELSQLSLQVNQDDNSNNGDNTSIDTTAYGNNANSIYQEDNSIVQ